MQEQSNPADDDSIPQNPGGFILDRRKSRYSEESYDPLIHDSDSGGKNKEKKSLTSSLKRFIKYINSNQKALEKSGKPFCLSRLTILELKSLRESKGIATARSFDHYVKDIIIERLRKSDRIFSNDLCDYVILMPNTDDVQGNMALKRIISNLADQTFIESNLSIRPSSVYKLLDGSSTKGKTAFNLLDQLAVDTSEISSKDSPGELNGASSKNKSASDFDGSTSEWLKRYSLFEVEESKNSVLCRDYVIDNELVLKLRLGTDSWAGDRLVLFKKFDLSQAQLSLLESNKKEIVSCMRQLQSLKNSSIASLSDFHLDHNCLYVVDLLPRNSYVVTSTSKQWLEDKQIDRNTICQKLILKKLLLKVSGAFSSLQSLVPPVVPNDFSYLYLLFDGESGSNDIYTNMTVINYEISHLKELFGFSKNELESNRIIEKFVEFALDLNKNCINCDDELLISLLNELRGGKMKLKYNSFSKLKSLFED